MKHLLSSAFHPQTDGQTERINRFIEDYLRNFISPVQDDWDQFLHLAEFAYNRRFHSTIQMSPFEADLGYVPYIPNDIANDPEFEMFNQQNQDFLLKQEATLRKAQDPIAKAQDRMKKNYDKNRPVQIFKIGGKVYWTL